MDHAHLMGASERRGDLQGDLRRTIPAESATLDMREERLAGDVLHHQVGETIELAEVGDLDDVAMVDPIDGARLAEKTLAVIGVEAEILAEDLDRAQTIDHHVTRQVDRRHAARTEAP